MNLTQRISLWNDHMMGLPRKAALAALTILGAALGVLLLRWVWPFALAFLFSGITEPFVRFAAKGFSRMGLSQRKSRVLAAVLGMILLFGLAGAAFSALVGWLLRELTGFLRTLPQLFQWINDHALPALLGIYSRYRAVLPEYVPTLLENAFSSLGQNALRWAGTLSGWLTSGAWSTAASIPTVLLSVVLTVMGTYYMSADRKRIAAFFQNSFPHSVLQRGRLIRSKLWTALLGQLRSQLTVSAVVMFFLMIALGLSGIRYGVIIGMLIGISDALPLLGAGLFLLPWSLVSFLTGQTGMGITLACLYLGAILLRQILEPKLVGQSLGLHPLATMAAMFAGYRILGFAGLLAGPVLLNAVKAVLEADRAVTADRP